MKNKSVIYFLICAVLAIVVVAFFVVKKNIQPSPDNIQQATKIEQKDSSRSKSTSGSDQNSTTDNQSNQNQIQIQIQTIDPISNALSRITKKPFGIYIAPKNSPVQPEKFQGYHTGSDLEINKDEQDADVAVKALCEGNLLVKRFASGYGGVAVQACVLDSRKVTVIYGHLHLSSVNAKVGDSLKAGDFLGYLGKGFSSETDGERKHLHLGIHKGDGINILGYVQVKNQLSMWLDPAVYLK